MKKICLLFLLFGVGRLWCQDLYDINHITQIELTFPIDDWDEQMDVNYAAGNETRLIGKCVVNGVLYDSVGVSFRGNSTYNPSSLKNPLHIKLDYVLNQYYQGYNSLKLSNGYKDPSFVREVLSYEIGRTYMDMPLSNYAKVTVNGAYYGLFSSSVSINDKYHERRLHCGSRNVRFQCTPLSTEGGGASLNYLGTDSSNYYDFYTLKSAIGWRDLIELTYRLQTNISDIETYLDVDRTLWMLAFNTVLVNLDSYTGPFKRNYYLIQDNEGRFLPIVWDLNQCLGGFAMLTDGVVASVTDLAEMDLFLRDGNTAYPLINQLLTVPSYKKMYVAHVKTMVEEFFSSDEYLDRASEIQDIIESEVAAEPNGFYSVDAFASSLSATVDEGGESVYGISELMSARVDYLEGLPEFGYTAPAISAVHYSTDFPLAYTTVSITALISDAAHAYLAYRSNLGGSFDKVEMFDDGLHGDGTSGDGVYGAFVSLDASDIHYYIYAENDSAGKFSPVRAAHEYYSLTVGGSVVINELMAKNESVVADQDGEYDDWIELFNKTDEPIDLSGYYLSDQPNENPAKWKFPEGTVINGNDYLIIWADKDTLQEGLHANFKLSGNGERIAFSDAEGFTIATVSYPQLIGETTYGRYENGVGGYIRMVPTPAAENSFTSLSVEEGFSEKVYAVMAYPNPASDKITVHFAAQTHQLLQVYNLSGALVCEQNVHEQTTIDVSNWEGGLYVMYFPEIGVSKKIVVKK